MKYETIAELRQTCGNTETCSILELFTVFTVFSLFFKLDILAVNTQGNAIILTVKENNRCYVKITM